MFVVTLLLLVISCFALIVAYPTSLKDVDRAMRAAPPQPRLLIDPSTELERVRAAETRLLHSYFWVDKARGVVHVPIEQAMQKLARSGIDGFPREAQ